MNRAAICIPIFFPIIATILSAFVLKGNDSLEPLFISIILICGGSVFLAILGKVANQTNSAKAIMYFVIAIIFGFIAAAFSAAVGFFTMLVMPFGRA